MNEWLPSIQGFFGPDVHGAMVFVTDWAGPLGWFIVLQLVFIWGGFQRGLQLSVAVSIALLTNSWLKWLIAEPRPFFLDPNLANAHTTAGFGMPSGHAQGAAAMWGGMAAQWWHQHKLLACLMLLLALVTGITRNYLGVHSPAQVIVGLILGALLLWATLALWPRLCRTAAQLSWTQQWLALVALVIVFIAVGESILFVQKDFAVPALWLENYAHVAALTSDDAEVVAADLALFSNGAALLAGLFAGFVCMAILNGRWSLAVLDGKHRWILFGCALVLNLAYLSVLGSLGEAPTEALLPIMATLHPVICLYLPWRVLSRRVNV